jgi:hypothetical protein
MAIHIPRRQFLVVLGATAVVTPLAALAQPATPVIGFLSVFLDAAFAVAPLG